MGESLFAGANNFRGRNGSSQNHTHKRKDFRDDLFSIFINNINPVVDAVSLWGIFKVFGKVRDVYLSSKSSHRQSLFAFIRFATLEEASSVASKVNGMHIYGWPIAGKIASSDWRNRSAPVSRPFKDNRGDSFATNPVKKGAFQRGGFKTERSFAQVVNNITHRKDSRDQEVPVTKSLQFEWKNKASDEEWLSFCAVGVLREFASVESVNHRLSAEGFSFSASYLGDKSILWTFNSIQERDNFINQKDLWFECFSAMVQWSVSLTPQSRLVWISCYGIPLHYWNTSFFMKIAWNVGVPLFIDEETSSRARFDRGRILVLIPHDQQCPSKFSVSASSGVFSVNIQEETERVQSNWLDLHLGLKTNRSSTFEKPFLNKVGGNSGFGTGFDPPNHSFSALGCRGSERKEGTVRKQGQRPNLIKRDGSNSVKGKEIWVRKPKLKFKPFHFGNEPLNLAKSKGVGGPGHSRVSESSSSSTGTADRAFGFFRFKGEHSKAGYDLGGVSTAEAQTGDVMGRVSTEEAQVLALNYKSPTSPPHARYQVSSSGPVLVSELEGGKGPNLKVWVDLTDKSLESKVLPSANYLAPDNVVASMSVSSSDSQLASVSDGTVVVESAPTPPSPRKKRGRQPCLLPRLLHLKVRKPKVGANNQRAVKVKKGVRFSKAVEEEVEKVIGLGRELGMDFHGKEQDFSKILASIEEEDVTRYTEEDNGQ